MDDASIFSQVFNGLPRQGPGSPEDTLAALTYVKNDFDSVKSILDVGCGSGAQSMTLLNNTQAHLTAVDLSGVLLSKLQASAQADGHNSRLTTVKCSMKNMPFPPNSFDLIWSEGAIYILGFEAALESFRTLLRPKGRIAVSHMAWLVEDPPQAALDWMKQEGAFTLHDLENRAIISRQGYRLLKAFTLSAAGWWDHYLTPLSARIDKARKETSDEKDLAILNELDNEIAVHRAHLGSYGYVFYVAELWSD
jgi:SAM-dependent methyltransferase